MMCIRTKVFEFEFLTSLNHPEMMTNLNIYKREISEEKCIDAV